MRTASHIPFCKMRVEKRKCAHFCWLQTTSATDRRLLAGCFWVLHIAGALLFPARCKTGQVETRSFTLTFGGPWACEQKSRATKRYHMIADDLPSTLKTPIIAQTITSTTFHSHGQFVDSLKKLHCVLARSVCDVASRSVDRTVFNCCFSSCTRFSRHRWRCCARRDGPYFVSARWVNENTLMCLNL